MNSSSLRFTLLLLFCITIKSYIFSSKTIIDNPENWHLVLTLPYGDTIVIPKELHVINNYTIVRPITIINFGTYTQQAPHQTVSAFINAGTLILFGSICDWPCTFINTGDVDVDDEDDLTDITEVYSCSIIVGLSSINNPPAGTPCDDDDPNTTDDVIINEKTCECAGVAIADNQSSTPSAQDIPTLSEWSLLVLILLINIAGTIAVRHRIRNQYYYKL